MNLAKHRLARKRRPFSFEVLEIRSVLNSDDSIAGDWETYGNGSAHTGYVSGILGAISNVPAWSRTWDKVGDVAPGDLKQAVTGMGLVFVSGGGRLTALDQSSGNIVWSHVFGPFSRLGAPTYDQGQIFLSRDGAEQYDSQLWAFNASTGVINWTSVYGGGYDSLSFPPAVGNGNVYVGAKQGLVGFNSSNGDRLFQQVVAHTFSWTPTFVDGRLYSWTQGYLTEHSPTTGQAYWTLGLLGSEKYDHSTEQRIAVIANNVAYGSARTGNFQDSGIHVVELSNKSKRNKFGDEYTVANPAVDRTSLFYIGGSFLRERDLRYGADSAIYVPREKLQGQPIVTDDAVIVRGETKTFIFDRVTKNLRLTLPVTGQISLANNTLYVAQSTGVVSAFRVGGAVQWVVAVPTEIPEKASRFSGTITIAQAFSSDLVIQLESSDPSRLSVPSEVQLKSGQRAVTFEGVIRDNNSVDALRTVTITANVLGKKVAVSVVRILEDDSSLISSIDSDWQSIGNGASRTGYVSGNVGSSIATAPLWSKNLFSDQIVTGEGLVFTLDRRNSVSVVAVDSRSGTEVWRRLLYDQPAQVSMLTYADKRLFAILTSRLSNATQILSLDALTGDIVWLTSVSGSSIYNASINSNDGMLYVSLASLDRGSSLVVLRQSDGVVVSQYDNSIQEDAYFSIHDDLFLTTSRSTQLQIISVSNPDQRWYLPLDPNHKGTYGSGSSTIARKKAFWDDGKSIYAIDLERKQLLWSRQIPNRGMRPAYANGVVYVFEQSLIKSYDSDTGAQIAVYDAGELLDGMPIVTDDAIIASSNSSTFVFDKVTRAKRSTFPIGGIASLANDTIYVADQKGIVQAFGLRAKPKISIQVPNQASEQSGRLIAAGTVQIDAPLAEILEVSIYSTSPTQLQVPDKVVIQAGATSAKFDLQIVDNPFVDMSAAVNVFAVGENFHNGLSNIRILDDEPVRETKLDGNWNIFGNGFEHTGYFPGTVGTNLNAELLWSIKKPNFARNGQNPVVVNDGTAYVTANNHYGNEELLAVDVRSGDVRWRIEAPGAFEIGEPGIHNGNVYFTTIGEFAEVWCVNANNSSLVWKTTLGKNRLSPSAPLVIGTTVLVSSQNKPGLYGLDLSTGWPKFFHEFPVEGPLQHSAYMERFFAWNGKMFQEHSPNTGEVLFQFETNTFRNTYSSFAAMGTDTAVAIAGSSSGYLAELHAIDLTQRRSKWQLKGVFSGSPAIVDDTVFAIEGFAVKAFDLETGRILRNYQAHGELVGQPIITDDSIIIASIDKTFVFDRASGQIRLTLPKGGALSLSDQTIFISAQDGLYVYSLQTVMRLQAETQLTEHSSLRTQEGKILFSKPAERDVRVRLETTDPYRIKLPADVVVRRGETTASFTFELLDNETVEPYPQVLIRAFAPGFQPDTLKIALLDNEPSFLRIMLPPSLVEGSSGIATVYVDYPPSKDTTIEFVNSNPFELIVPKSVTLRAFNRSVDFAIKSNDDLIEDGPKQIELRAKATNWSGHSSSVPIIDDEIPTIRLNVPSTIREDAGAVSGIVSIPYPKYTETVIEIASSDSGIVMPPGRVRILSGETYVSFQLTIINDGRLLGARDVQITARGDQFTAATKRLLVVDDETASMSLVVPEVQTEGVGAVIGAGRIQLNRAPDRDVEIQLRSSDRSKVEVPPSVVLRAGERSVVFDLNFPNNYRIDGPRSVTITSTIPGWASSSSNIRIADDDQQGLRGDWSTFGNGDSRDGYIEGYFGFQPYIVGQWNKSIGNQLLNDPATGNGFVFTTPKFGSGTIPLVATKLSSGEEEWRHSFASQSSLTAPSYHDGRIFVMSNEASGVSKLWAFDAASGNVLWQFDFERPISTLLSPLFSDGRLLVSDSNSGSLFALDPIDGTLLYVSSLELRDSWAPAAQPGSIFLWSQGKFTALQSSGGEVVWSIDIEPQIDSGKMNVPVVSSHSAFMVGSQGMYAVGLLEKRVNWKVEGEFQGIPAFSRGTVFVVQHDWVQSYDSKTGAYQGGIKVGGEGLGNLLVSDDSIVVSNNQSTFILNRETKQIAAKLPVAGAPILSNDQLLVAFERLSAYWINPKLPWTNSIDNKDVNGDNDVSPIDVLALINHLNQSGSHVLPKEKPLDAYYLDVDRDGSIGPLDVLTIINWINSEHAGAEGSGEGEDSKRYIATDLAYSDLDHDFFHRRKRSSIKENGTRS